MAVVRRWAKSRNARSSRTASAWFSEVAIAFTSRHFQRDRFATSALPAISSGTPSFFKHYRCEGHNACFARLNLPNLQATAAARERAVAAPAKAETSDQDNTNGQDNHRPDDDPAATRLAAAADPSDTVQSTAEDRIGERNQGWRGGRSCTEQGYTEQGYAERGDAKKVPQAATAFAGESLSASVMPRRIRFDRCRPSAEDS